MAQDMFPNVYSAAVTQSAANTLTFVQLNLGIGFRDFLGVAIDSLRFYPLAAMVNEMTTDNDRLHMAITTSDTVTDITDMSDQRVVEAWSLTRKDFGTAASAQLYTRPWLIEFAPPILALPQRLYLGLDSAGLASAGTAQLRMHYRTVNISQQQQLVEVLETFAQGS